jgi:hypothetical protein
MTDERRPFAPGGPASNDSGAPTTVDHDATPDPSHSVPGPPPSRTGDEGKEGAGGTETPAIKPGDRAGEGAGLTVDDPGGRP